jgi:hypothetical protein
VKLTTDFHLVPSSRMVELYLHCSIRRHGVMRIQVHEKRNVINVTLTEFMFRFAGHVERIVHMINEYK